MDKFSFGGTLSFGKVKQRVQAAQKDLGASFLSIADKAKKEAKIVNRKARKALATEDGGSLREDYVLTVNLDAGHELFKRFQNNWALMHHTSIENAKKAEKVDIHVNSFTKQWSKYNEFLNEFHGNLLMLPDVIAKVEIAQKRIEAIGLQTKKVEELILEYEDACERCAFEVQKNELKLKLSQLLETKSAEYTLKKNMLKGTSDETLVSPDSTPIKQTTTQKMPLERQQSQEKQKAYEDAFLDQMNQYIQYGELEKPIAGSVNEAGLGSIDDIQIEDSDWSTLSEFLGPDELDSVKQAHTASIKKALSTDKLESDETIESSMENVDATSYADDKDDIVEELQEPCKDFSSNGTETELNTDVTEIKKGNNDIV